MTATAAPDRGRLRVPFSIGELYGGLAKADGILHFDGRELVLEFQVKDDVVGYVSSGVKTVVVPLPEIVSLKLTTGWFGLTNLLELRAGNLFTLRNVPRSGKRPGQAPYLETRHSVGTAFG